MTKCYYPKCDFEGTQAEVDDHLAHIGTDPDHDWPVVEGRRLRRQLYGPGQILKRRGGQ